METMRDLGQGAPPPSSSSPRRRLRMVCTSAALLLATLALAALLGTNAAVSTAAAAPAAGAFSQPQDQAADPLALLAVQQATLTASGGAHLDQFGASVSISGDTALVGAPHAWVNPPLHEGVAYVFVRSGTTWTQQATLIAGDGATDDRFGASVALSGETALVGAPGHDIAGKQNAGAAYVFVRSGGSWTKQAKLTGDYVHFGAESFGAAVALEGDTALIGAPLHNGVTFPWVGAAYVFVRSGAGWTQQSYLVLSDPGGSIAFGSSVALSGDTAVIGTPNWGRYADEAKGAAYVFVRSGTTWNQQQKLNASDAAVYDYFGGAVAVSGNTALIGAAGRGAQWSTIEDHGGVYVFERSGSVWTEQAVWTGDTAIHNVFGTSLALSGDTALVGSPQANANWGPAGPGHVWVFVRSGGVWAQQSPLLSASDGVQGEAFGISVALSGDTYLVGAQWRGATPSWPGAAYVFGAAADTIGPRCAAKNVTVKHGKTCKIHFKVYDALSTQVTTQIKITTKRGAVKKAWSHGYGENYKGWWYQSYRCTLKKGSYRIIVTGKDLAGNKASVVGRATLTVK